MRVGKVEGVLSRLEAIEQKAERQAERLNSAFDATDETLDLVGETADAFLTVSARIRGKLGAGSNFPPKGE